MNLFDIDNRLITLVEENFDPETGEILEGNELRQRIDEVNMSLNDKISNIACYIKNLKSDADALKAEKDKLAKRQKSAENQAEWLKRYLDSYLQSVINPDELPKFKYKDEKCVVGYRKSESVNITDLNSIPQEYIKPHELSESDVNKTAIKDAIKKNGKTVNGAEIIQKENISIR